MHEHCHWILQLEVGLTGLITDYFGPYSRLKLIWEMSIFRPNVQASLRHARKQKQKELNVNYCSWFPSRHVPVHQSICSSYDMHNSALKVDPRAKMDKQLLGVIGGCSSSFFFQYSSVRENVYYKGQFEREKHSFAWFLTLQGVWWKVRIRAEISVPKLEHLSLWLVIEQETRKTIVSFLCQFTIVY